MARVIRTTINDSRLASYRNLKRTNSTRWSRQFVVEGEKLVLRLLESRYQVTSIVVDERSLSRVPRELPDDLELFVVPNCEIPALVGFNFHRGMLACGLREPELPLSRLAERAPHRTTWVACPNVEDPENLGAILRISAAFGVDGVLLGEACSDHLSRRVLRVSMGNVLQLRVLRSADLGRDFAALSSLGFEIVAGIASSSAEELATAPRGDRLVLVLGNEGHGLDPRWSPYCDRQITIGMRPGVDSLNVAVAAGICLHHFTRLGRK